MNISVHYIKSEGLCPQVISWLCAQAVGTVCLSLCFRSPHSQMLLGTVVCILQQ